MKDWDEYSRLLDRSDSMWTFGMKCEVVQLGHFGGNAGWPRNDGSDGWWSWIDAAIMREVENNMLDTTAFLF